VEVRLVAGKVAVMAAVKMGQVPVVLALQEDAVEVSAAVGHIHVMSDLHGDCRCSQQDDCSQVVVGSK